MAAKRHHYVPETYLNYFLAPDGKISVYRKDNPNEPFRSVPRNVALERFYYAATREDGIRDTDTMEEIFSKAESKWPTIIDMIEKGEASRAIVNDLLEFTCLQRARVPAVRDAYELMRADSTLLYAKFLQKNGKLPPPPVGAEDILDRVEVSVDPEASLAAIRLSMTGMIDRILPKIGFVVMRNRTRLDFITSDNPVMWFIPYRNEESIKPYEFLEGAPFEFLFPLTPRLLLVGSPEFVERFKSFGMGYGDIEDVEKVKRVNRFTARFAYRFVIATDGSHSKLVEKYSELSPVMRMSSSPLDSGERFALQFEFSKVREKARWRPTN